MDPIISNMDDDMSFHSYCIYCDRLIVPPKELRSEKSKKKAGGAIRVKNADGTTTTRTANGQKTTRPGLKRNSNSAGKLANVATNNCAKLQPLTRSSTSENVTEINDKCDSSSESPTPPEAPTPVEAPFRSTVYCSRECASADNDRCSTTLGLEHRLGHLSLDRINTNVSHPSSGKSPMAPPSPLFTGSDTESSTGLATSGPTSSAPKFLDYFRMSREGPDAAWHEHQRQRRSSTHSARPTEMSRQKSHNSQYLSAGDTASSDSLSSMWHEYDYIDRTTSSSGKFRGMTPIVPSGKRSSSSSSGEGVPAPIPPRQIPRSSLSHTSLTTSPGGKSSPLPAEFGSAPNHTLGLFESFTNAFPTRHPSGNSYSQKAFINPGSYGAATPSETSSRRASIAAGACRPVSGTIRRKSRGEVTWDSFGKAEMNERSKKVPVPTAEVRVESVYDCTPKQSLEVDGTGWQMKCVASDSRPRSRASVRIDADAISIPQTLATSVSTIDGQTPRETGTMPPPSFIPSRPSSALPIPGSQPLPYPVDNSTSKSVPRTQWKWDETKCGKTYELPKSFKVNSNKSLFYFH